MKNMGFDGFIWFFGTVENNDDPEKIGRVQVRIFNMHSESKADISTANLQWASVGQDITSASHKGVGRSPTGIAKGSMVFGFFLDAEQSQQPAILAVFPGKPGGESDVSKLARGENILKKDKAKHEPSSPYKAKYPHNQTITTAAGHAIEMDDTPGAERLHVYHKSGSYVEIGPKGDTVFKSVGDEYNIVIKDKVLYVKGSLNIESDQEITIKAPSITIEEG